MRTNIAFIAYQHSIYCAEIYSTKILANSEINHQHQIHCIKSPAPPLFFQILKHPTTPCNSQISNRTRSSPKWSSNKQYYVESTVLSCVWTPTQTQHSKFEYINIDRLPPHTHLESTEIGQNWCIDFVLICVNFWSIFRRFCWIFFSFSHLQLPKWFLFNLSETSNTTPGIYRNRPDSICIDLCRFMSISLIFPIKMNLDW